MNQAAAPRPMRKRLFAAIKVAVTLLVVVFVWRSVEDAWRELRTQAIRPDYGLLAAAGLIYLVGLAPMGWFWGRVLRAMHQPAAWRHVMSAFYLGHLGKYVPGKATVLVVRVGTLRELGGRAAPITASVFVETMTLMAVGAALTSLLLMTMLSGLGDQAWLGPVMVLFALLAVLSTAPPVLGWVFRWIASTTDESGDEPTFSWPLLLSGWSAALVTWLGMAASLWVTLRALDANFPLTPETGLRCLLATTLPVVAGFLAFTPGGLLVRDGLMFALLKPLTMVAEPTALAATVLLRLVWIVFEALGCAIMIIVRRGGSRGSDRSAQGSRP